MLKIINATWGYKGYFIDVSHILITKINSDGDLIIEVNTTILTDPCRGWTKELNAIYEYEGKKYQIIVQEKHPQSKRGRVLKIAKGIATTSTRYPGLLKIDGLI